MIAIYRACDSDVFPAKRDLSVDTEGPRPDRPKWFSKISCFDTFDAAVKCSRHVSGVRIVFDGPKGELSKHIESLGYSIDYIDVRSNEASLQHCLNLSDELHDECDSIYFVEDDYLHEPEALDVIYDGVKNFGLVTGYDHPDRYFQTDDICRGHEMIHVLDTGHWRTAESTTCTWAYRTDCHGYLVPAAKHFNLNDRDFFRWVLQDGKMRLWTPIPGVTTHVHPDYLSPCIDWEYVNGSD